MPSIVAENKVSAPGQLAKKLNRNIGLFDLLDDDLI